jgi:DNA-binding CsgD family transcriptional regulator
MSTNYQNYGLYFRFINTYLPAGFQEINRQDPLLLELEEMTENNRQFFYVADLIRLQILFTSKRSTQMMGTEPDKFTPDRTLEVRHPDDKEKHLILRGKLFKAAHELYNSEKGEMIFSSCTRILNHENKYVPVLSQAWFFYTETPFKTVYLLMVFTDVSMCSKMQCAHHHYFGNDVSYFRYPDELLMETGNIFSDRELEIIQLLAKGLNTKQISDKLFLSPFTVNTHRSNILQKSGKASVHELLSWLTELGML